MAKRYVNVYDLKERRDRIIDLEYVVTIEPHGRSWVIGTLSNEYHISRQAKEYVAKVLMLYKREGK